MADRMVAVAERARKPWFLLVQIPPLTLAFVLFRFDLRPLLLAAALAATYVVMAIQRQRLIERATRAGELNRRLAASAGVTVHPRRPAQATTVRALRPGFVVAFASTLVVVALTLVERRNVGDLERWAREADRVCAVMSDAYRASNSFRSQDALELPTPMPRIAEARRIAVLVEREGLSRIQRLELPRHDVAKAAVRSFEAKLEVTELTARLAAAGDRAALDRAAQAVVATGTHARDAFAAAGAPVCSSLM